MSVSINNQQYASFGNRPDQGRQPSREVRRPLVIEGEKISIHVERAPHTAAQTQQPPKTTTPAGNAAKSQLEAKPVKDIEQLFITKPVIPARSPLAVFASIAQTSTLKLGASVDTFV